MRQFLIQTCRRSLFAGAASGGLTFAGMLVIRAILKAMDIEPSSIWSAFEIAAAIGAISFVLCIALETANSALRRVRASKPQKSEEIVVEETKAGDTP